MHSLRTDDAQWVKESGAGWIRIDCYYEEFEIAVVNAKAYDLKAHARAIYLHRDLINPAGRKIDHDTRPKEILAKSLDDAVTKVIDDLDQNLESLLTKAGWNEIVDVPCLAPDMKNDLKDAEEFLLNLIVHPERIPATPDKALLIRQ